MSDRSLCGPTRCSRAVKWLVFAALALAGTVAATIYLAPAEPSSDGSPSWSPDAKRIVYYSERDGFSEIYVMDADGSNIKQVTHHQANNGYPSFSPDGSRIVFDSNRDGSFEIYIVNAGGSHLQRLTNHPARDVSPAWSPDGRQIAFMSDRTGSMEIWVMSADGSNPKQVTDLGSCWFPQWSPDGTKLAFHVHRDIHVLNLKDSKLVRLTTDPANGMHPSWSPDGRQIAFMSWRDGPTEIYKMDADGSNVRRLTYTSLGDSIDPRWSPDGTRIVYVHVADKDRRGGRTIRLVTPNKDG
jgi:TolB protein